MSLWEAAGDAVCHACLGSADDSSRPNEPSCATAISGPVCFHVPGTAPVQCRGYPGCGAFPREWQHVLPALVPVGWHRARVTMPPPLMLCFESLGWHAEPTLPNMLGELQSDAAPAPPQGHLSHWRQGQPWRSCCDLRCEKVKSFLKRSCYRGAEHFIPPLYLPQYLLSMSKYLCFYKFLQNESPSCLNQQRPHQTLSLRLELIINLKHLTTFCGMILLSPQLIRAVLWF